MTRPAKYRKEIHLSTTEKQYLQAAAKYYGLDETSTMRLLMRMGYMALTKTNFPEPFDKDLAAARTKQS